MPPHRSPPAVAVAGCALRALNRHAELHRAPHAYLAPLGLDAPTHDVSVVLARLGGADAASARRFVQNCRQGLYGGLRYDSLLEAAAAASDADCGTPSGVISVNEAASRLIAAGREFSESTNVWG